MRNIVQVISIVILLSISSCISVKQIGEVNMISHRNIDASQKYQLLTTYSGGSQKELRKADAKTIENAIDNTVKKVAGGEYLMNAKIYLVTHFKAAYIAVEGDVWGIASNISFRGYKVGDKVMWKNKALKSKFDVTGKEKFITGIIQSLKDDKTCYVKIDGEDRTVELKYDDLSKN